MTQPDEHGARILAFLEGYQRQHHRSPTYREIGAAVGLVSSDHVARDLRRLANQGYLSYTPGVSRSIVLLKTPRAQARTANLALPHFNTALGKSRAPSQELTQLAANLFPDEKDTFMLCPRGEALREANLDEGDLVVVKRGEDYSEGDMLAIWLKRENRTTLKYLYRENGRLKLYSSSADAAPQYVRPSDIEIRGTVLAILRKSEM